ncbi:hypothetical protein [Streptomyces sp. enrichment culture]|uniref:hypothetical protein n=1 Tax=Streptomyces sp. enrichment culture TaxID=1795815 RepID=UPI003F54EFF6
MVEFVLDTARSLTDLIFTGTLARHPGLKAAVPHCGGALPVLAGRIDGFSRLFMPGEAPVPDAVAQLRRLHHDLAGPVARRVVRHRARPGAGHRLALPDHRRRPDPVPPRAH